MEEMGKLKLVIFDVDGTLVKVNSSWQHLHEVLGTWDQGEQYAEQFFRGAITYEEWARLDASLWKGLPLERVREIIYALPYFDGAKDVIVVLRKSGFKVVLLSAGLSLVTERIEGDLGVDYSLANELIVKDGFLTGGVKVKVPFDAKLSVLRRLLLRFGVSMAECAAVGDDETLIPLFKKVGLGISFNPHSERVERSARFVVKSDDLRDILPFLLAGNV